MTFKNDIIKGIIGITVILKGISNIMLSLIITLFSLDNKRSEIDFKYNEEKIEAMLNELSIQDVMVSNAKR